MASSLGNFTLWLSLCFTIFQFVISRKKSQDKILQFNRIAVIGLLLCTLSSFFSLMYSYIVSDFSVINVFQNSHTTKPLIYKIAGVWGNHEGSMLLWLLVLSIINYFIFRLYNQRKFLTYFKNFTRYRDSSLSVFIIYTFTSNPFERMNRQYLLNGLGFNPILQDPALAIHPTTYFILGM